MIRDYLKIQQKKLSYEENYSEIGKMEKEKKVIKKKEKYIAKDGKKLFYYDIYLVKLIQINH